GDYFVHHYLGIGFGRYGETPHGNILLVAKVLFQSFTVVKGAKEAIVYKAIDLIKRVLTLKTE
ncbi:hypothetical protein NL360_28695, partial [Klebsiella pneumoniae]|nr:hypothetical protein [Klebsiella pneumoniae]